MSVPIDIDLDPTAVDPGDPGQTPAGPPDRRSPVVRFLDNHYVRQTLEVAGGAGIFLWALQWLWPTPAGVVVQGIIIGSLTALISFGIALIYRSNRVLNFAQSDLGAVPASLGVVLIAAQRWSYRLALPLA